MLPGAQRSAGRLTLPRRRAPNDLIPRALRAEVQTAMANNYPLAKIHQLFMVEGFELPPNFEQPGESQRRALVAAFESTIDFTLADDAEGYLRVIDRLLEELSDTYRAQSWASAYEGRERILRELDRAGIDPSAEPLHLPSTLIGSLSLAAAPTESGIRLAITRLQRSGAEPEEKVGAAKELVEATIKYALVALAEAYDPHGDISDLSKQLHKRLLLDPKAIAPTIKGSETIVGILRALTQVPQGLAALRNQGYGTGHGQAKRISGIKPRHADLAARSAIAYASFILDTLADPEAPWR